MGQVAETPGTAPDVYGDRRQQLGRVLLVLSLLAVIVTGEVVGTTVRDLWFFVLVVALDPIVREVRHEEGSPAQARLLLVVLAVIGAFGLVYVTVRVFWLYGCAVALAPAFRWLGSRARGRWDLGLLILLTTAVFSLILWTVFLVHT